MQTDNVCFFLGGGVSHKSGVTRFNPVALASAYFIYDMWLKNKLVRAEMPHHENPLGAPYLIAMVIKNLCKKYVFTIWHQLCVLFDGVLYMC